MVIFKDTNYKSLVYLGLCFRLSVLLRKTLILFVSPLMLYAGTLEWNKCPFTINMRMCRAVLYSGCSKLTTGMQIY